MLVNLVLPPLSQLNTPYPSISYLARHLRSQGINCHQRDVGIELFLQIFSHSGLTTIFDAIEALADQQELPEPVWRTLAMRESHQAWIEPVIAFLQGSDRTVASQIVSGQGLPMGPRLERANLSRFGAFSTDDLARHLATLYLEDLVDVIRETVDPGLGLAQYQHHLALGPVQWKPIQDRLDQTTLIDSWLDQFADLLTHNSPDLVGISIPFPGMLYGALRLGRRLRRDGIPVLMGGGYVNTELRNVDEPGLWQCTDGLIYDDGEGPLMAWLNHMSGGPDHRYRTRTATQDFDTTRKDKGFTSAAWYGDLPLDQYLQIVDATNPTHRLWSDGRWNKITLAHGCYWKRCAFCDIHLDYIDRFESAGIPNLVDQIEELVDDTGIRGFHMVDEAAPPRLMRDLALELLARNIRVSWWGNIRFERSFTPDLCRLLSAAGLMAVTGGLEVASDRLLKRMEKGITVEQAARAAHAFQQADVLVHAYLMYGFPSETTQESMDAMEIVRQMFAAGILDSGYWHRFVLTRHSGVFAHPQKYGIRIAPIPEAFATNDIPHVDLKGGLHDAFDQPLVMALQSWMNGNHLERCVESWFPTDMPPTQEPPNRIREALESVSPAWRPTQRLVWLGGQVFESDRGLVVHHNQGEALIESRAEILDWTAEVLDAAIPAAPKLQVQDALSVFPGSESERDNLLAILRQSGLVAV